MIMIIFKNLEQYVQSESVLKVFYYMRFGLKEAQEQLKHNP